MKELFIEGAAYAWPTVPAGCLAYSRQDPATPRPVATLEGRSRPTRAVSTHQGRGQTPVPEGPPDPAADLWLCYPGRIWAVSAATDAPMFGNDDPAWLIGELLSIAVDYDEPSRFDGMSDTGTLVIDGRRHSARRYTFGDLIARAVRLGPSVFCAVGPIDQADTISLSTRPAELVI